MTDVIVKRKKTSVDVEGTLSKSEMSEILNQTERILGDIKGKSDFGEDYGTPVRNASTMRELKRRYDILNEKAPKTLTAKEKDDLANRMEELEDIIKKDMPTQSEMWRRPGIDGMDSDRAVRKNMHWEKTTGKAVGEWKSIARTLDPDDPSASNVERLRTQR